MDSTDHGYGQGSVRLSERSGLAAYQQKLSSVTAFVSLIIQYQSVTESNL
jgi:hypothetical protein